MRWIASTAKDEASKTLEKRVWDAGDQLRANSELKASPILGLIVLRFAAKFAARHAELEESAPGRLGSRAG